MPGDGEVGVEGEELVGGCCEGRVGAGEREGVVVWVEDVDVGVPGGRGEDVVVWWGCALGIGVSFGMAIWVCCVIVETGIRIGRRLGIGTHVEDTV
jgi:hypothetical protein